MTNNTNQVPWSKKIDEIAQTYISLEETGHISPGAVSENVNWEEIKGVFRTLLSEKATELESRLEGEFKRQIQAANNNAKNHKERVNIEYFVGLEQGLRTARAEAITISKDVLK